MHGGIIFIDQHLGDDCDALALDTAARKFVVQGLLNHVANSALGIRAARVERYSVNHVAGIFGAQQDKADLRAVAVGDDHVPALVNHVGDVDSGFSHGSELVRDAFMCFIFDERVASDGNNGQFTHRTSRKSGSIA